MKGWVELWVRLKVIDLVSQTAWMTLTEKLDFDGVLCGMVRYSYWGMEADGSTGDGIISGIDRVIRLDSAFTNQNKHFYRLGLSMEKGSEPEKVTGDLKLGGDYPIMEEGEGAGGGKLYACDLLVTELGSDRGAGYAARLNARLDDVKVSGVVSGEVWRMIVRAGSEDEAKIKVEDMAVTRSRREGLLLNPHYQQYGFIGTHLLESVKEK